MGTYSFGPFRLDAETEILFRGNEPTDAGHRALAVLRVLVEQPGVPVSKTVLIDAAWPNLAVEESNLSVQIAALRKVLGQEPGGENWIETLPRRGYRFIGPVTGELETGLSRGTPATRCLPQPLLESSVGDTPGSWETADSRPHPMVGRDAPLEVLDRIMQRVLTGRRQIALVTGEAGIGKTAFIETALARLSQQGVDLLCGCCTERFGNDEAFLPLIDALITRCRAADGGKLLTLVRAYAPTWLVHIAGHISPAERAAFQHEMFGATRERMLLEFCDLLQALSAARPCALVLEDLHWSDFSTLDVISRFARGTDKVRVLVLGSYRPADSAIGDHPIRRLHQDLEIHGRCTELPLDRLSLAEVERYLALRFGNDALASTLATSVFERTQGQPLFVSSLLNHYIDKRVIVQTGGAWRLSSEVSISEDRVPNDLVKMITYQIGHLTEDERRLLEAASVAGGEFSAALVAAGLSRETVEVERDLEALVRKENTIMRSGVSEWPDGTYSGSYAFHHILYQNVIYQQLAPALRVQTHQRLGKRLEEAYGGRTSEIASVLALHFEVGRNFAGAVRYLGQAAESSAKRLGHAEAVRYLDRALGILDRFERAPGDLKVRIALLRQRSWAHRSCGDLAASVRDLNELIACAERAGDLRHEINGLLAISRFCLHADRRICLQATQDVLARSQALDDDIFKALVRGSSASINLYLRGWHEQDAALCIKALELIAGAHDHGTLIRRYGIEGILDLWRARYQECRRSATQGKRLAREAGDIFIFVLFNMLESNALINLGEWRELQRETTAALELARKNANDPASVLCRLTLSWLHVEAMDFDGARTLCEGIDNKFLNDNHFAYFYQRAVLAKAFFGLGDLQQALKQFNDVQRRIDEDGLPMDFPIFTAHYHCFGEYFLQTGEIELARKWAIQLHDYVASAPDNNHLAQAYGLLARIAFAAGDRNEARGHLSQALLLVDNADFPLAAWRVYYAASEIFMKIGQIGEAIKYQNRFVAVLRKLAQNFEPDDRLHSSLSNALAARMAHWGLVDDQPEVC